MRLSTILKKSIKFSCVFFFISVYFIITNTILSPYLNIFRCGVTTGVNILQLHVNLYHFQQDRQSTYDVRLRRIRVKIDAVLKQ
jgi:hypothetical protein